METVEILILKNLIYSEEYGRKVLPFIKKNYFENTSQQVVFEEISKFLTQYNKLASKEILCIEIENRSDINESSFKDVIGVVDQLEETTSELSWLIDTTEKWCRDRAIYLALMESIALVDGKDKEKDT